MKDKNGEITFKSFFKWLRSESGKKYGFFIFYIFFFIFIFVFLSFTGDTTTDNNKQSNDDTVIEQEEINNSLPFNVEYLEENDYKFQYRVLVNEREKEYLGQKKNDLITISNDIGIYTYEYKNGNLIENSLLNEYYQLFDIYEIKRLIKTSKYNYKQEYNDGKVIYSYLITNGDLANFLEIENIKDDLENEILVRTNQENELIEITFDILNLVNNSNNENKLYKIIITYGDNNE